MIAEVGPDGQYLNTKHTLKHYRERWYPKLFERSTYESWLKEGGKSLVERAGERVERILVEHKPESLPQKIQQRLQSIVNRS